MCGIFHEFKKKWKKKEKTRDRATIFRVLKDPQSPRYSLQVGGRMCVYNEMLAQPLIFHEKSQPKNRAACWKPQIQPMDKGLAPSVQIL